MRDQGQLGQAIKQSQMASYVNPNIQKSRFLRAREKLVLPSIFDTCLSSLVMWNPQSYQQQFWIKKMTFLWEGSKHIMTLLHIFKGLRSPTPWNLCPYAREVHVTKCSVQLTEWRPPAVCRSLQCRSLDAVHLHAGSHLFHMEKNTSTLVSGNFC